MTERLSDEEFAEIVAFIGAHYSAGEESRRCLAEAHRARRGEEALRKRAEKAEALLLIIAEAGGLSVAIADAKALAARADKAEADALRLLEAIEKIAAGVHETWKDANCERIARAALEGR